jgi:hypothetical protein
LIITALEFANAEVRVQDQDFSRLRCPTSRKGCEKWGTREGLVAVVVVLVPVTLGVPAVFVLVPPAVTFTPAALAGRVQFTTLVIGMSAVASISFDGLVKCMLGVDDTALTAVVVFGVKSWDCGEESYSQYGS